MKCLKCNSAVKKSQYSGFNGFETYRCVSCNELFEIRDFKDQIKNMELVKPEFKYNHMGQYFDTMIREGSVRIPTGAGKTLMLAKISEHNSQVLILVANRMMIENFDRLVGDTTLAIVQVDKFLANINLYKNKYTTLIIDEQYPSKLRKLQNKLKEIGWDEKKTFYITSGT